MLEMTDATPINAVDPFLAAFDHLETNTPDDEPSWVPPLRKAGLTRFAEQGFPSLQMEDWRFTNVSALSKLPFRFPTGEVTPAIAAERLRSLPFAGLDAIRLVFVDGIFNDALSRREDTGDAVVSPLRSALATHGDLIQRHLAQHARETANPFVALNEAYFQDGLFLHLPRGCQLRKPVEVLQLSTNARSGMSVQPRHLILAEAGSQGKVLESHLSLGGEAGFTNAVNEFVIGDNVRFEHVKFQDENPVSYHLATLHAHLGRDSHFACHSIALGARLSRNNIHTVLGGEGIHCVLNGLYVTDKDRVADHHMIVEHAKPHCESHEYFNGILDDTSRGVFHGRILVQPDAQKTDAKQTNKNLLLADGATINTKPQLEIYADDVKCTHGATIGQLNHEAIFYLRTRGISEETARQMLIHAFAGEIIDRIGNEALREEIDRIVWERLEQSPHL